MVADLTETDCSFCGKSYRDAFRLVAGNAGYICDSCVDVCAEIIRKEREAAKADQESQRLKIKP